MNLVGLGERVCVTEVRKTEGVGRDEVERALGVGVEEEEKDGWRGGVSR